MLNIPGTGTRPRVDLRETARMPMDGLFLNAKDRRDLNPGEVFFSAGDTGDEMFGVVSGLIELRRDDQVLDRVRPGGTFGEMAIIDHAPRALTAVAVERSEIAVITRSMFLFLVTETPMFAIQVMQSLASRIRELDDRI
jgi:CRP/FNR family transcriptional regulator, cyclic AMP receptor protein